MLKHIRNYFFTGLFLLIPVAVTVKLLIWGFEKTDSILGDIFFKIFKMRIPGAGLITLLILITLTGLLAHNYLGRKLIKFGDRIISKIPILNNIYGTSKQIIESFTNTEKSVFRKMVLIEYPRPGIYSPGFLTGTSPAEVTEKTGESLLSIFVPTVPNPATGFLVFLPEEKIIFLDMSVEEGFKLIISAGVIKPN